MAFTTPIQQDIFQQEGISYVDDVDMLIDSDGTNGPEKTLNRMQEIVDYCEGTAKSKGGAIKTNKSWCFYSTTIGTAENWTYGDPSSLDNTNFSSLDLENKRDNPEHLPPDKGKKMLGVYLTSNGFNKL